MGDASHHRFLLPVDIIFVICEEVSAELKLVIVIWIFVKISKALEEMNMRFKSMRERLAGITVYLDYSLGFFSSLCLFAAADMWSINLGLLCSK